MDTEIWKDIKDYEGLYQVSNMGRVKSLNFHRTGKEKVLKPIPNIHGYLYVHLCYKIKTKAYKVHRLVAEAFLPNPDNLPEVNHKSEIKSQNYVWVNEDGTIDPEKSNLEWCSKTYNCNYGTRVQRIKDKKSKSVKQLTLNGELIHIWKSAEETNKKGFNKKCVTFCCLNSDKQMTHMGFKWEYV